MDVTSDLGDLVDGARTAVVLIGRGGTGKTQAIQHVIDAASVADLPVRQIRGGRLNRDEPFSAVEDLLGLELLERLLGEPTRLDRLAARRAIVESLDPGLLVVEDAQWIDLESLALLVSAGSSVSATGFRMLVAHRPRASRELAALDEVLTREHRPIMLSSADEDDVRKQLANSSVGSFGDEHVERIATLTDGVSSLVGATIEAAESDQLQFDTWLGGGAIPPVIVDVVRGRVAHLSTGASRTLMALAYGAAPDSPELADLLAGDGENDGAVDLVAAIDELDDEGLLTRDGRDVIPLVAEAATELQPPVERRRHHRRYADALAARGGSAVERAEHLMASDVAPDELAPVCVAAADELMGHLPALALPWLDEAERCGVSSSQLASRRVRALVRDGKPSAALRAAEPLYRNEVPGRLGGLQQVAVAFTQIRRPAQAAGILQQIIPRLEEHEAQIARLTTGLCLAAAGEYDKARDAIAEFDLTALANEPTLEVVRLLVAAMMAFLDDDIERAVASAVEASELESSAATRDRLAMVGTTLAPVMAVFGCDHDEAARVARRALSAPVATDAQRRSRLLRSILTDVWTGRTEAGEATDLDELHPADKLIAVAATVGAARRANDTVALRDQRDRMIEVLAQAPDLISLPAYGEVLIAAARLGLHEKVADARVARDQRLFATPVPTSLRVHRAWVDLQAAVVADDAEAIAAVRPEIEALDTSGRPAALRQAMLTWCRVAGGEADSDEVRTAGEALHDLGLRWEATRLVGSAALRIEDDGAKELLAAAREMRASIPGQETEATPLPARLSERELEVAEQLITGITYKEIGSRLFISPKTVEHHVARMRQRLGATSRSELMQMLRAELGG